VLLWLAVLLVELVVVRAAAAVVALMSTGYVRCSRLW
jgi:hypothetical protein